MSEQNLEINAVAPNVLEHFTGNQSIIERVKVALEASWNDGAKFPNTLMVGPPGLGKTLLATIISKEMGAEQLHEQLGSNLNWRGTLAGFLMEPHAREVALIDEVDNMASQSQVGLYRALEDRRVFTDAAGSESSHAIPIDDFTLVCCTNNEYSLVAPLRERFRLTLRFNYYSPEEMVKLIDQRAKMLHWETQPEVLPLLAQRGRGVPRVGLRLLEACRRTARAESATTVTAAHFERTMSLEGIDQLGLDELERRYLTILAESGGVVRVGVVAARLGLPMRTVSEIIEEYLLREGLVVRADEGRSLTPKGLRHVQGEKVHIDSKGA